jgi:acetolactate synthase I/III small subunit
VISGQDGVVEQARRQLEDLVRTNPPSPRPLN